jgi:hypothetical protein
MSESVTAGCRSGALNETGLILRTSARTVAAEGLT